MSGLTILPPAPGVCQICAIEHAPEEPHNRDSLYYQYRFYAEHHRWPTWADAMAHCSTEVQEIVKNVLARKGVSEDQP